MKKKCILELQEEEDKKDILQRMGNEYKIEFTPQETEKFAGMENFGVDIRELKQLLAKPASELMKVDNHQTGIPYKDSLNNQLASWVRNARESSWQRKESFLKVAIKGDAK